ncbi:hypothetical protein [Prevotella pallens]
MRCENVANGLQQRDKHSANALLTDCEYVANGLQQCGDGLRKRGKQIATTWRTNCNNATFKKQKPYFCNSKTPFLHDKNHTFARQKPYFCNANM